MRLADAATHFHTYVCADYYTPATTFKCQFDLFDDARRDGLTVERRIMVLAPDVVIPARRTIVTADGKIWLVGDDQSDYFGTDVLRRKYVVHLVGSVATVRTYAQALAASGGFTAYASRSWIKGGRQLDTSDLITNEYNIYFSRTETALAAGTLISLDGHWHAVRVVYPTLAGYLVALADELLDPVVTTCTFTSRVYVPTTDTYTTTPSTVAAIKLRWQEHFNYVTKDVNKYLPGDLMLIVLKTAATPKANDLVTVAGENYVVDSVTSEGLCWSLHLKHV